MLVLGTLALMAGVAYAFFREGLFTAATTLVNVFLAGLLTFNFYEPLAPGMGGLFGRLSRVWLAMMHRAGTHAFSRGELRPDESTGPDDTLRTFDRFGSFESNYLRFRRARD